MQKPLKTYDIVLQNIFVFINYFIVYNLKGSGKCTFSLYFGNSKTFMRSN